MPNRVIVEMCTKVTDRATQRQAKQPNSPHSVTSKFLSRVYLGVCFVPFRKFSHFLLRDLSASSDVFISQGLCASPASTPCPVTAPPLGQIMQTLFFTAHSKRILNFIAHVAMTLLFRTWPAPLLCSLSTRVAALPVN